LVQLYEVILANRLLLLSRPRVLIGLALLVAYITARPLQSIKSFNMKEPCITNIFACGFYQCLLLNLVKWLIVL
jgi:hypothetical protein